MMLIIQIAGGILLAWGAVGLLKLVLENYERRHTRIIPWTDEEYAEIYGDVAARRRSFTIKTRLELSEDHFNSGEVDVTLCGKRHCDCRALYYDPPPGLNIGNPQGERMHW